MEGCVAMSEDNGWQFELNEYIKQGEPEQVEKSEAWQTAIGLQAVDGLKTSDYLLDTAKEHIEGKINIEQAQKRIQSYYEEREERMEVEAETREADIVATRIAKLLGEKTFQFSPAEWLMIHRRLFEGVFPFAGQIRTYNITKKEWVLRGDTVIYASYDSIRAILDYDFNTEKQFSYEGLELREVVAHLAKFASDIWQIHPFCEGNTRATAVFLIKYMKTFGFEVNNDVFERYSWYFRNALVRANYNDLRNGVHATTKFLEMFFSNLLIGTDYELKNRHMHLDYGNRIAEDQLQSASFKVPKCQGKKNNGTLDGILNDTLKISKDERAILERLQGDPGITQMQLAEELGKSLRTVKREMAGLKEKGYIQRIHGKRNGKWQILLERW